MLILLLSSISLVTAKTDSAYDETDKTTFKIDADTIEIQKDQTELEKQSIIKETEYRVKLEARKRQINTLWSLYSTTFILFYHIVLGMVLIAITRLIVFFLVDFIPLTIIKMAEVFMRWSRR
jgi:hypothetical protein